MLEDACAGQDLGHSFSFESFSIGKGADAEAGGVNAASATTFEVGLLCRLGSTRRIHCCSAAVMLQLLLHCTQDKRERRDPHLPPADCQLMATSLIA